MLEVGKENGINFTFDGHTANTLDSHRIITWAASKGKQNEVVEGCFKRYFEEGKAPNDREGLLSAVEDAGLDKDEAAALLDSDELKAEVVDEASLIRASYRVTGVPFFIISSGEGKPISFGGAQDAETIQEVFEEALEHPRASV